MDEEERYLFEVQGYLHIPAALDASELQRLNASVDGSPQPPTPPAPARKDDWPPACPPESRYGYPCKEE